MQIRDEIIETLKLSEVLLPPWLRGAYQLLLAGIESGWKELDEVRKQQEEE